jgi:uncharacterized protein
MALPSLLAVKVSDVENVHLKNRNRFVTDQAGALSATTIAQADTLLARIWNSTSAEPVAVIVDSLEGEDVNEYATELFTLWGIGKKDKDNGVLVLVSVGDHKAVIRTGYGVEGVLPDAIAATIIRNNMIPHFRTNDYDSGLIEGLTTMSSVLTDPDAREELMSQYANDASADDDTDDFFPIYLVLCGIVAGVMLIAVLITYAEARKLPTADGYARLQKIKLPCLVGTVCALCIPIVSYLILVLLMRHVRLRKRLCPHCATRMQRVDEENDNNYLTQAQDTEERLNSVDYDVWLCPQCGETDIIPYVNPQNTYSVCPQCGARACSLISRRIVYPATEFREGRGIEETYCRSCGRRSRQQFIVPKVVAAPIIIGGGGGRGFGGGGGFSGGSFGGGSTGGGGASGSW